MARRTVVGIFDHAADAEKACEELLHAGVARHRIVKQEQRPNAYSVGALVGRMPDPEGFDEAVRGAAAVVAVVARSHIDQRAIADLMLRHGARGTVEAPA